MAEPPPLSVPLPAGKPGATAPGARPDSSGPAAPPTGGVAPGQADVPPSLQPPEPGDDAVTVLTRRLVTEGQYSSLSARRLFLERALLVYAATPPLGVGLEEAQRSHRTTAS
jgi:hypothetical protein